MKNWLAVVILVFTMAVVEADSFNIYGKAHVSADISRNGDNRNGSKDDVFSVSSNNSRFGLKGDQSLSETMKVIWQFENVIHLDDGGLGSGRNAFLGLKGNLGSIKLGKIDTPYKSVSGKFDIFSDTRADYNSVIGNINGSKLFNRRAPNIIIYSSPKDKPFQVSLARFTQFSDGDDLLPQQKAGNSLHEVGQTVVVSFNRDVFKSFLAYERLGNATAVANQFKNATAYKVGGVYNFDQGTKITLVFENITTGEKTADRKENKRDAVYMNLSHVDGNNTYKAGFGYLDNRESVKHSGANHLALGVYRAFSKETQGYVIYAANRNQKNANYGLADGGDTVKSGINGENITSLSLGMILKFSKF